LSNRKPLLPLNKNKSKKRLIEKPKSKCRKGLRHRLKRSKWKKSWSSLRGFRNNKELQRRKLPTSKGSWRNSSRSRERPKSSKRNSKNNSFRICSGKERGKNSFLKSKEKKKPKCKRPLKRSCWPRKDNSRNKRMTSLMQRRSDKRDTDLPAQE